MSQEDVEKLLGRLLTDDRLRYQAKTQLDAVCRELGLSLTDEELEQIRLEDLARLSMASNWLSERIKRAEQPSARYRRSVSTKA